MLGNDVLYGASIIMVATAIVRKLLGFSFFRDRLASETDWPRRQIFGDRGGSAGASITGGYVRRCCEAQ